MNDRTVLLCKLLPWAIMIAFLFALSLMAFRPPAAILVTVLFLGFLLIVRRVDTTTVKASLAGKTRPREPACEDARPFQFDLRDMLLAFVFVAAWMGMVGPWGAVVGGYLLIVICLLRIIKATRSRQAWRALLFVLIVGMAGLVIPAVRHAHSDTRRRAICGNNLKQIGYALRNYEVTHGRLPGACIANGNGTTIHSWRVALLPQLDRPDLWAAYNPNKPWNGPGNSAIALSMPREYACPSDLNAGPPMTNYAAIVGPGTAWADDGALRTADFPDGASNTLLVAEVANSGIHWMEPRDLTLADLAQGMKPAQGRGISSHHQLGNGAFVLYADGHVQFLSSGVSPTVLKSLATIDDGRAIDRDRLNKQYPAEGERPTLGEEFGPMVAMIIMLVSGGVLVFRPFRKVGEEPGIVKCPAERTDS